MLAARLPAGRAAAEPAAVHALTGLCARLPLALAIAAARAAVRPGLSLDELAAELRDAASRLDVLDGQDAATSMRAVLSWSYDQLSPAAARLFRLLGLHPGPDISAPAAASLGGISVTAARLALAELTAVSLLAEPVWGRYAFHDLLRTYAAEQARVAEDEQARDAATGRLLDHYLHTACAAANLINLARDPVAIPALRPGVTPEHLADHQQALAWFAAEHQVLLAAIPLATSTGLYAHAWQIPWTMAGHLHFRGQWHEMAAIQRMALAAAERIGDMAGQAASLDLLTDACWRLGDYDQVLTHCAASRSLYQQLGNPLGEAKVYKHLAATADRQGRYADALSYAEQALRLYQAAGHRAGEARMLNNVGWFHALLGDYQLARVHCTKSVALTAELSGQSSDEAHAWDSLGYIEHHLGNLAEAARCYQRALSIFREFGDRYYEAMILMHLGDTRRAAGELLPGREAWRQALDILDELDHPDAGQVRAKLAGQPESAPAR